jgi:hypothetical protein
MTVERLTLSRAQILAYRRTVGALDERLPAGSASLRRAAWAGLQDSAPRAALLSIHARVDGTEPSTWEDPALVQVWGPRFSAFLVPSEDAAIFTLARLPDSDTKRRSAAELADRLDAFLGGRRLSYAQAGRALGVHPNMLRYAAPTGRVRIRWDGARRPTIWTVPPPDIDPREALLELGRRYLHVFGPSTPTGFGDWAGLKPPRANAAFDSLTESLTPVRTPIGHAWILTSDEPQFRAESGPPAPARLLPSGDAYWLLWGVDRELLVPDPGRRRELWTPRVWPGAVLVGGEVVGTWRRSQANVSIRAWRRLVPAEREAVVAEAESFPLPDVQGRIRVGWEDGAD